jgi:hypothetical protein
MSTANVSTAPAKSVEINFEPTLRERFAANLFIGLRRFRRYIYLLVFFSIFSSVVIFAAVLAGPGATRGFTPDVLFVIFASPLIFLATIVATSYFEARSFTTGKTPLPRSTRWLFSENGVETKDPVAATQLQWSAFIYVRETKSLFLLFSHRHYAHVIPKRAFSGAESLVSFRELLRRHCAPQIEKR